MHLQDDTLTLLIDGQSGHDLTLAEGGLHVLSLGRTARVVPIRRVGRVILRRPANPTLLALQELVTRGSSVHLQDGNGQIIASLIPTEANLLPEVRELIFRVEAGDPRTDYAEWMDLQLRHAASRILRHNPRGGVRLFEGQLMRYARRGMIGNEFNAAWNEIRGLMYAWIDSELTRHRLRTLASALERHKLNLIRDLDRALTIPLLWAFAPWFRAHRVHQPRERMEFFDGQRRKLEGRFTLALAALHYHLDRPRKTEKDPHYGRRPGGRGFPARARGIFT